VTIGKRVATAANEVAASNQKIESSETRAARTAPVAVPPMRAAMTAVSTRALSRESLAGSAVRNGGNEVMAV
jgi:hypothetical protein